MVNHQKLGKAEIYDRLNAILLNYLSHRLFVGVFSDPERMARTIREISGVYQG
jgi:hypothetical protein